MSRFKPGQLVEVIGCIMCPPLNGMCGEVIQRRDYLKEAYKEAYDVRFDHGEEYMYAWVLRPLPPFDFKLLKAELREHSV